MESSTAVALGGCLFYNVRIINFDGYSSDGYIITGLVGELLSMLGLVSERYSSMC